MHTMEKLINYMHQNPTSTKEEIARGIGISRAVLYGLLSDHNGEKTYAGNKSDNYRKIERFLELQTLMENAVPEIDFVPTEKTREIWDTLDFALINKEMVCITGNAGRGKSRAVEEWVYDHENAIYIEAFGSASTVLFFEDLAAVLKIDPSISTGRIVQEAIRRLYGSNRPIIVDDAHYLPFKAMANLRYIHQKAEVGLVLEGIPYLLDQMLSPKAMRKWEQIYSKFAIRTIVKDLTLEESAKIVRSVFPGASISAIRKAYHVSGGSIRELCNYIQRARLAGSPHFEIPHPEPEEIVEAEEIIKEAVEA